MDLGMVLGRFRTLGIADEMIGVVRTAVYEANFVEMLRCPPVQLL